MMGGTVALCLDEESLRHPEYLGLDGESLQQQHWLEVFDDSVFARSFLRQAKSIDEVWVVSSNDIEPINLAASLKRDRPDLQIKLVAPTAGGSLRSRATNASIDEVLELSAFVRIYAEAKRRALIKDESASRNKLLELPDPRKDASRKNDAENTQQVGKKTRDSFAVKPASAPEESRTETCCSPQSGLRIRESEFRQRKGFLVSILSGSGGSGKSSVAALAALEAAQKGYKTLLIDYDLQFGDIAYIFRNIPSCRIDRILEDTKEKHLVFEQDAPLVVIGAPEHFETSEQIGGHISALTEEASQYFDVIIANTGANWTEQHAILLEKSSVVLFLIDQRGSSLRACNHALELCARCGIASVPFKFALNRCSKNAPFSPNEIAGIIHSSQVFELRDGGEEVEECLASGNAFELRERGNDFALSIEHMMRQILPQIEAPSAQASIAKGKEPLRRKRGLRKNRRHSKVAL